MSFTRNDSNAAKIGGSARINATGGYEGVITRAEPLPRKDSGALGIQIDFKSHDGATALFLDLYYQNGTGEELSGRRLIDALMLCLRVKSMEPTLATVDKWDKNSGGMIKTKANCFVELMGKPIGLVLQKEHSTYQGQPREKMLIYACYDIASRKTPKEIIERAPKAVALDAILGSIKDKVEKPKGGAGGGYQQQQSSMPPSGFPDDDDIPY
jgi:hypothetical protein